MLTRRTILRGLSACFVLFLYCSFFEIPACTASDLPQSKSIHPIEAIQVWYGEKQQFGFPGLAQPYVNIPGRVSNHNEVESLSFSLNDGPQHALHIGPDGRRLAAAGDFNVEIHADDLQPGNNSLRITRTLKDNHSDVQYVTISYQVQPWPLPYRVEWSKVSVIQDAVQVVDGLWHLTETGIRTAPKQMRYDRTLALGDTSWSSYELLVPFTLNDIDFSAYGSPESVSPGFGLIMHWNGHTDTPVVCGQPHCGWFPVGAIHWYSFPENKPGGFGINTRPISDLSVALPFELQTETSYLLRSRVEAFAFKNRYFLKIWKQGEEEPIEWSLQRTADRKNPDNGGVLIVAHHVDLTIGNIEIQPVTLENPFSFKAYLVFLPQFLTVLAGLLFLGMTVVKTKSGPKIRVALVVFFLAAIIILTCMEPLLPTVLSRYPFNEMMSAVLYIGYDYSNALLQILVWLIILFSIFCNGQKEAEK
jgi:hypothetical protein